MANTLFYRCEKCSNTMLMLKNGGGTPSCCGSTMTELKPNTTDGAKEKHVPFIIEENGKIHVAVGSTLHPSLPEHYIEWIALITGEKAEIVYLKPGMEPKAEFEGASSGAVYEYCNLHGLWKADF